MKIFFSAVFFCMAFSVPLSCECSQQPLRFALQVLISKQHTAQKFANFCGALTDITGRDIELIYLENYVDILDLLSNNSLDLAYLGPLPYVLAARKNNHIQPLVRFLAQAKEPEYTCALVGFCSDELPINIKHVALTQPYSTCGFMVTESLLQQDNLSLKLIPYTYTLNHENAALAVVRGTATVAGVKTSIARQFENLGVKILRQSEPVPGFLLVGNGQTINDAELIHLRHELLKRFPCCIPDVSNEALSNMTDYGLIPAKDEDYNIIRHMLKEYPVPEISL